MFSQSRFESDVVDDVTKMSGREFQIGTILTAKKCLRMLLLARGTARRREFPRKFVLLGKLRKSEKVSAEKPMNNIETEYKVIYKAPVLKRLQFNFNKTISITNILKTREPFSECPLNALN